MVSKEFFKQLEVIAEEKKIDLEHVIEATKKSLINAYKKTYGNTSARIEIRPEKNEILLYSQHFVVEELANDETEMPQITLIEAQKISSKYRVGDVVEQPISPKDFGRIAASTGKQVFNQTLKQIEKENNYNFFKKYEGEMIVADVVGINEQYITLSIGQNTTTLLPTREILPNDRFVIGDRIKVYLVNVENTTKGPKVYVSRLDKNLVTRLMETIIPEISEGIIEIKGIARDAGDRTKIAIFSNDEKVDAIGSCVGEAGNRIKEVVNALNGEKIDLYRYSSDVKELIANSLQPADVVAVIDIDPKEKTSLAIVPDDQLSLAIGKSGQNVRLAVQSCGWKIDIKSESDAKKEGLDF
jgi:transcription termination/antitermination protein NusA